MAQAAIGEQEQTVEGEARATSKQTAEQTGQPYPPSWIDRFTNWVQRLPGPAWLFYAGVGIVLSLLRTIVGWNDGSYPVGTFFRIHILDCLNPAYLLLVLHYLDDMAQKSLANFRAVLNVDEPGYQRLRYQFTTMPSRPVFVLTVIGVIFGLAYIPFLLTEADRQTSKYFTSPAAVALDSLNSVLVTTMMLTFAYHTFHQLRIVSRTYTRHTNVSIFDIGPLYALSRVTAMTTVACLFLGYVDIASYSDLQGNSPVTGVVAVIFVFIALGTFVWPLFGAHRLLQQEKERWKSDVARRMEAVNLELLRRTDAGDYSDAGTMNDAIDSLIKAQGVLGKVSTWPWDPEAVRVVVTAVLLPVGLWIVTRVLERLGF
jgi:hypothetical protein